MPYFYFPSVFRILLLLKYASIFFSWNMIPPCPFFRNFRHFLCDNIWNSSKTVKQISIHVSGGAQLFWNCPFYDSFLNDLIPLNFFAHYPLLMGSIGTGTFCFYFTIKAQDFRHKTNNYCQNSSQWLSWFIFTWYKPITLTINVYDRVYFQWQNKHFPPILYQWLRAEEWIVSNTLESGEL